MSSARQNDHQGLRRYTRTELIDGAPKEVDCVDTCGQTFEIHGSMIKTALVADPWFHDLRQPEEIIGKLSGAADLLAFWQRLPETEPLYPYYMEPEPIALLELDSYEEWWKHGIKSRIRTSIRKARKTGVVVSEVPFDDNFIEGMTRIFNETPVRQGRQFWHFGKDFETVKEQFSRNVHRETMIGAYFNGEMIGFAMLADAGTFTLLGQILSSVHHRDKVPNNCLIAQAVETSIELGHRNLVYGYWSDGTLSEFKRRCGFSARDVPSYFVPLTWRGRLALKLGVHRGWRNLIPKSARPALMNLRHRWYQLLSRTKGASGG